MSCRWRRLIHTLWITLFIQARVAPRNLSFALLDRTRYFQPTIFLQHSSNNSSWLCLLIGMIPNIFCVSVDHTSAQPTSFRRINRKDSRILRCTEQLKSICIELWEVQQLAVLA